MFQSWAPRVALFAAVCVFMAAINSAHAVVIDVPGDQATIQAGINAAANGDTVLVGPGTYVTNIDFGGKMVCLRSSDGAAVTIIEPAVSNVSAVRCAANDPPGAELSGFTLTGAPDLAPPLVSIAIGSTLKVQFCVFHDNPVDNVVIQSNGDGVVIRYNLFIRNGGNSCIGVSSGSTSIINNTFDDNLRGFYGIGGVTMATNNIISNCAEYAVFGAFVSLSYNNLWNNAQNYGGGASEGIGGITADPLYSDPPGGDYTLQAGSPCVDAGHPDPPYNDPDGSRNDIGAFPLHGYFLSPPVVPNIAIGLSGDSMHVTEPAPHFSWTYTDSWNLPHSASEIEVGSDNQWSVAEMWNPAVIAGDATSISYGGATLVQGTTYFVRVRVYNDTLWSEWLAAPFRMNSPPSQCQLLFPPSETILLTGSPTLVTINSTDPEGDVLKYDFIVSLDVDNYNIVASAFGITAGSTKTSWTVDTLTAENQKHWWRARATDGFTPGIWSDQRTFWLDGYNDPPGPVILVAPAQDVSDLELRPLFVWSPASDPDPGAAPCYSVILATDPGLIEATPVDGLDSTYLEWPFVLTRGTQYWWQVTADDGRGGTSESEVRSFQTSLVCTLCPHQCDYDADGFSTALDIAFMIDILYSGLPDIQDQDCLLSRSDFDCDGFASALDLGALIDYVFVGGQPPCDPCSL